MLVWEVAYVCMSSDDWAESSLQVPGKKNLLVVVWNGLEKINLQVAILKFSLQVAMSEI